MPDILLVEDSSDDVALALRAFSRHHPDCQVAVARDGEEALQYLFSWPRENEPGTRLPHVVLLDLNLPKLSGVEVLKRMRADSRTCLLPVVMLTTSVEAADLEDCYQCGANSYVRKPVDYQDFLEVVRQLAGYWLDVNRLPN